MSRIIAGIATAVLAAGVGVATPSTAQAATAPSTCPYVFLVPHSDDETLTMGAGIRQHVVQYGGDKVCVVLMTDGTNSQVQDKMRDASYNPDGKAYNLTDAQFTAARDKEEWNALLHMGVPAANIYINGYTQPNTGVPRIFDANNGSAAQAAKIDQWVGATMNYFGTARHYKTMSDKTTDVGDHHAMGMALRARSNSSKVLSARFYAEPYRTVSVTVGTVTYSATDKVQLQKANNAFRVWNPASGYYQIGYRSVKALLDAHYINPVSYQHA